MTSTPSLYSKNYNINEKATIYNGQQQYIFYFSFINKCKLHNISE